MLFNVVVAYCSAGDAVATKDKKRVDRCHQLAVFNPWHASLTGPAVTRLSIL